MSIENRILGYLSTRPLPGVLNREQLLTLINAQLEQTNSLLKKLRENYIRSKTVFAETAGLGKDDPRYLSATWTRRWCVLNCEAYSKFVEDIRPETQPDKEKWIHHLMLMKDFEENTK